VADLFSEVWNAIEYFPWSAVVLVALLVVLVALKPRILRNQFPTQFERIKRTKVGPTRFEVEFFEELANLREAATTAAEEVVIAQEGHFLAPTATATGEAHGSFVVSEL
jgi:hypothetical protein